MAAPPADHGRRAPRVIAAEDKDHLAEEAGRIVLAEIERAVAARGRAAVILSGGTTPRILHAWLAGNFADRRLPVNGITWYLGDERWAPVTDPQSNEGMARETLLAPLGVEEAAIVSWHAGSGDPVDCARRYGDTLNTRLESDAPDVVLLGIGPDGHTASLFPGSTAFLPGAQVPVGADMPGTAAAIRGGSAPGWRLTLCPGVLRLARQVVFLASGADKVAAVQRAVNGDPATPAAWVRGEQTTFVVTRDALGVRV